MMYCWSHPQQQVAGFLLSMAKNLVQPHFKKKIWTIPLRTSCYLPLSFFSSYLFVLILFCFWCRVAFVDSSLETLLKGFTVAADQRCISPPTRQNCYFHAMLHREFIAVSTDCVHGWVSCYYLSVSFPYPLCLFAPGQRGGFGAPYGLQGGKCKPAKTNCITSYWQEGRNCAPVICLRFAN